MQKMVAGNGLLFPIFGFASCVAFIYMSFGDFILTNHQEHRELSFVGRNGTQFMVDGRAFYINGWNSYWLMDHSVDEDRKPRVSAMLEAGAKMGLTVCRTWAFNDGGYNALQVSPGRFDERVLRALDHVIAEARQHGIRLLLSLVNNLKAYGGKTQYVNWAWEEGIGLSSSNDSFFFDPSIKRYFKHYVKTLLTRKNTITGIEYRNDPTIFAWELMNEPRCMSDPSGDTLQDWIEEMSAFVKTIDKNHLLTVGLEGFYGPKNPKRLAVNPESWASSLGSDFVRNSKAPAIDFASVHIYPDHWFPHQEFEDKLKYVSKWMLSHIEDGHYELNKPVFFTEFGLSNMNKDFQPSQRDRFYKTIFDIIYKSSKRKRAGAVIFSVHRNCLVIQLLEPAEVEAMDVSGGNFTTTSLVTEGELATDPINGNANDQPYLVKPCEDPDSRFRIEEAEILVKSLNERRLEVDKKIAERRSDREDIISRLRILHEREKRLKDGVVLRKQQQGHLLVALDKLGFTNSAYQDREINLCLVDDDINCRNLNFKLLHGSKNLAAEKKLLREIKASEKEIQHLEIAKEKAIANATVKGKIWNSLGTKKALHEEIKVSLNNKIKIKFIFLHPPKQHLFLKAIIKKVEKKLPAVEKRIISLEQQLAHLRRQKDEANKHLIDKSCRLSRIQGITRQNQYLK
ncbi:hypothetical protein NC652_031780 [Populus alba x Populus x berolinensis]|nr:hypothetical protein NC652_031780 [Populus alba x Populus x berolinensis]